MLGVIGDPMIDEWLDLTSTRRNPENDRTLVVHVNKPALRCPGGTLNLAVNLARTSGTLVHVVPTWGWCSRELHQWLYATYNVFISSPFLGPESVTRKRRVSVDGVLMYREDKDVLPDPDQMEDRESMLQRLTYPWDALVVNDYDKGGVTPEIVVAALDAAARARAWLVLDVKPRLLRRWLDAGYSLAGDVRTVVKMNEDEAALVLDAAPTASALRARCDATFAVITRGERGAVCSDVDTENVFTAASRCVTPRSVCGAGDVFTALLTTSLVRGASFTCATSRAAIETTRLVESGAPYTLVCG